MSEIAKARVTGRPRAVTAEEIAFYRKNGWVHLRRLIAPETAASILDAIQGIAKPDTDAADSPYATFGALWKTMEDPSWRDESLLAFAHSREMGTVAADLQGRPVRWYRDEALCKMPVAHEASGPTPWHQDSPYNAFDRSGRPLIWLALNEVTPARGAMRFLSGSHLTGLLGRAFHDESGECQRQVDRLLKQLPLSPPLHLEPGDATVHDGMTIHSAGANTTDQPRWSYVVQYFVADALYTGAANRQTDRVTHLEVGKPLCDCHFPITGVPRVRQA